MNTKNIKLNIDKRAKYITAHIQTDAATKVFALLFVLLTLIICGFMATWLFQLIVNQHFADMPVRYALFFSIMAWGSFLLASAGYDKEAK